MKKHQHQQHQHQQSAAMVMVRLPDGNLGWVPRSAFGQDATAPAVPVAAKPSAIGVLLLLGGIGALVWWGHKQYKTSLYPREMGERSARGHVRSRRKRRSRSRLMSEFKHFLDEGESRSSREVEEFEEDEGMHEHAEEHADESCEECNV